MKTTITNPIFKDTVTFIETCHKSKGNCTRLELTLFPGGGNPMHYHKTFHETFTSIEGELTIKGKNGSRVLKPGQSYTVKPFELHCFCNTSNAEIKFSITIEPGSTGFENFLRIGYGLAEDGLTNAKSMPKKFQHTAVLMCMSDTNVPGIFKLFNPLFRRAYKQAQKSGEEQRLIDKYCV